MKVCFEKQDLKKFGIEELKKMLEIQVQSEKFEGASVIRDIIGDRKKDFGIGKSEDDVELQ